MALGRVVLLVYAALMLLGGIAGYAKAGSRPSLIAGTASAILLLVAWRLSTTNPPMGYWAGTALALVLSGMFVVRLARTGKVMPSGALLALSLVAAGLLAVAALGASKST
ncbi:MAG: TMEM14 family protein [Acidobacteriia bacterium]|nr:TMEM14 family protein [Terriglobia bacterium]